MTVRELIEDLQNNFANHLDLEVHIAERGRGDKIAALPVAFTSTFGSNFVSILVKDSPAHERFGRENE